MFAKRNREARINAEILIFMVKESHIATRELGKLRAMTLWVIAGEKNIIAKTLLKLIYNKTKDGDHIGRLFYRGQES